MHNAAWLGVVTGPYTTHKVPMLDGEVTAFVELAKIDKLSEATQGAKPQHKLARRRRCVI